jgi:hypothetical protein
MAVASWRVMEWQPTAIFAGEALFAYLNRPLLLAEIYVPFVWGTDARSVVQLTDPSARTSARLQQSPLARLNGSQAVATIACHPVPASRNQKWLGHEGHLGIAPTSGPAA